MISIEQIRQIAKVTWSKINKDTHILVITMADTEQDSFRAYREVDSTDSAVWLDYEDVPLERCINIPEVRAMGYGPLTDTLIIDVRQ